MDHKNVTERRATALEGDQVWRATEVVSLRDVAERLPHLQDELAAILNKVNANTTNWRDLLVYDAEGNTGETLGSMVEQCPANLDSATIENGRIVDWPQFFIAAPGEDPDWDTPRGEVDWTGFATAWREACGQAHETEED